MANLNLRVMVDVQGQDKLNTLGSKMTTVGRNLTLGVTLPLVAAGGAAVGLAKDAQKAGARVESVFESMEAAAWTNLEALDANAQKLADMSSFDDDEIKNAQATLLTFGDVTGDVFDDGLQAAVDMSELLEQDLQTSIIQVGKALNDPEKGLASLQRIGVQFTDEQKEVITGLLEIGDTAGAQAVILEELQRQFGGTAEAIAATDAGQMAQSFEELGEAGESAGSLLLPVLATLADWLRGAAEWFQDLDPGIQGFIVGLASVVAAVGPVLFIGGKLVGAFSSVVGAFKIMSTVLLANPFVALAAAVAAIVALIILNWDEIVAFLKGVWDKIMGGVRTLANMLEGAWKGISLVVSNIWDGIIGVIKGAINSVIGAINAFIGFINGIQIHIPAIEVGPIKTPAFDWWGLNLGTIPYLAEGGIVTRQTLAMLGEQGAEAVIPLDRFPLGETHFHSHIEVTGQEPFIRNEDDLIRTQQRIAFLEGF